MLAERHDVGSPPELAHRDVALAGGAEAVELRMRIGAVARLAVDADAAGVGKFGEAGRKTARPSGR